MLSPQAEQAKASQAAMPGSPLAPHRQRLYATRSGHSTNYATASPPLARRIAGSAARVHTGAMLDLPVFPAIVILSLLGTTLAASAAPPEDPDRRARAILKKMTLDEKLDYIGGIRGFYIRAIPRLKLPAFKMADGPIGVRNFGPSTAYAAGIGLAASWDEDLAGRVGAMIGKDARA